MPRTLLTLGLIFTVGCGPTVIVQPNTTSTGGSNGATNGGTGSSTGSTGSSTGSTGSSTGSTGSSTGSTGSSTGSTAGTTGGTTAGTTTGSTGGTTGASGGTTAGTTTGSTGGSTAGTTGSTGGTTAGTTGTTGGTTGGPVVIGPGTYDTTTQFNFEDALPPDVEEGVKMALEFTNSPGTFLLDVAGQIPVIKYVIDAIELFSGIKDKIVMGIDGYINDWSGGMVTTMHNLSVDIEMALRGLKSQNTLVVGKPDASGNVTISDTLTQLIFTYQGTDYYYPQSAHAVTMGTAKGLMLHVNEHTYDKGVRVGGMLVDLVDNVALPQLTGVNSLGELLNQLVNCGGVGTWVWSYIYDICLPDGTTCIGNYITQDDITKLCQNALDAAGQAIENKLSQLDAPGMMSISDGNCLAVENKGHTGHADTLSNGTWSLSLPVGVGTMTLPGTFTGVLGPDAGSR